MAAGVALLVSTCVLIWATATGLHTKPVRYQYATVNMSEATTESNLNTLGQQGWELVGIYDEKGIRMVALKRKL